MQVLQKNNKKLRMVSESIKVFDDKLKKLSVALIRTMQAKRGVGIASPQVGELIRMVIVKIDGFPTVMINPVITKKSNRQCIEVEGCLSVAGIQKNVRRHENVTVSFYDLDGDKITMALNRLSSRIAQHEIDHLDGILFIDKVFK